MFVSALFVSSGKSVELKVPQSLSQARLGRELLLRAQVVGVAALLLAAVHLGDSNNTVRG